MPPTSPSIRRSRDRRPGGLRRRLLDLVRHNLADARDTGTCRVGRTREHRADTGRDRGGGGLDRDGSEGLRQHGHRIGARRRPRGSRSTERRALDARGDGVPAISGRRSDAPEAPGQPREVQPGPGEAPGDLERPRAANARPDAGGLDTATLLRRGLLALAALGIAGTAVELVFLRHWQSATQLIAWPAVAGLGVGLVFLVGRPSRSVVQAVRVGAVAVAFVALVGVGLHVIENLDAGPLDRAYATTWDTMASVEQWWLAITGGVGPAPTLAPGILAEMSLALLLATIRHPALERA